ncbi:lipoyl(octanoyl) transferase LipB [soil metagenome]
MTAAIRVRDLGLAPYAEVLAAMRDFTASRDADTADEIWRVEHPPVYTLGLAGKREHLLDAGDVEVVQSDRGGQVTYHGPGQVIDYLLIDLRRRNLTIRGAVTRIEQAVIDMLATLGVEARRVTGAPGVYVNAPAGSPPPFEGLAKIAALGLKVSRGCTYHGVSLNVGMELAAFDAINPCGYARLAVTDLQHCGVDVEFADAATLLEQALQQQFPPT